MHKTEKLGQKEYIIKTILKVLERDQLLDEKNLYNEGLDSLNVVSLIIEFENDFDINIKDEDLSIDNFNDVEGILKLLKTYEVFI